MVAEATTKRPSELPPPRTQVGVIGWLRQNLFSTWYNALLTVLALYLIYEIVPPLIQWAFIDAYLSGDTREACVDREGACWVFIKVWFWQFIYGRYPIDERWRIDIAFIILILAAIPLFIPRFKWKGWIGVFLLVGYPVIAFFLFTGGTVTFNLAKWVPFILLIAGMVPIFMSRFQIKPWMGGYRRIYYPGFCVVVAAWIIFGRLELNFSFQGWNEVETRLWGGLFLTLVIAGVGIVMSLPIGVVLALGRRSNMPAVRAVCVAFIELWRGVPLITVLFMASVMFPLFMPEGMTFDKLLRALIGVMLFAAAYMAEVVRGGLQAIPKGQYEAAQAVGLSYWKMMGLIVLPQALRIVIPGIVNTFIALFKDTTLVLIIGLFDFLNMVQAAAQNPDWIGFNNEGYVFAALGFWIFCFGMSRYSQRLEKKLHTGHQR